MRHLLVAILLVGAASLVSAQVFLPAFRAAQTVWEFSMHAPRWDWRYVWYAVAGAVGAGVAHLERVSREWVAERVGRTPVEGYGSVPSALIDWVEPFPDIEFPPDEAFLAVLKSYAAEGFYGVMPPISLISAGRPVIGRLVLPISLSDYPLLAAATSIGPRSSVVSRYGSAPYWYVDEYPPVVTELPDWALSSRMAWWSSWWYLVREVDDHEFDWIVYMIAPSVGTYIDDSTPERLEMQYVVGYLPIVVPLAYSLEPLSPSCPYRAYAYVDMHVGVYRGFYSTWHDGWVGNVYRMGRYGYDFSRTLSLPSVVRMVYQVPEDAGLTTYTVYRLLGSAHAAMHAGLANIQYLAQYYDAVCTTREVPPLVLPWDVQGAPDYGVAVRQRDGAVVWWVARPVEALRDAFVPRRPFADRLVALVDVASHRFPFSVATTLRSVSPTSSLQDVAASLPCFAVGGGRYLCPEGTVWGFVSAASRVGVVVVLFVGVYAWLGRRLLPSLRI